jgi:hypothetical protein
MVDDNGTFTLWFSGPVDDASNGYETFSCAGPMGPCNTPAPNTTEGKPFLYGPCGRAAGDFTVFGDVMFCTMPNQTISEEILNNSYGDGDTGNEYTSENVGGLTQVEAPGVFLTASGRVALTYSSPNCAYCSSDSMGQSESLDFLHPFQPVYGTCVTGQPRTTVQITDQATGQVLNYEEYDLWNGSWTNESTAGLTFVPDPFS